MFFFRKTNSLTEIRTFFRCYFATFWIRSYKHGKCLRVVFFFVVVVCSMSYCPLLFLSALQQQSLASIQWLRCFAWTINYEISLSNNTTNATEKSCQWSLSLILILILIAKWTCWLLFLIMKIFSTIKYSSRIVLFF